MSLVLMKMKYAESRTAITAIGQRISAFLSPGSLMIGHEIKPMASPSEIEKDVTCRRTSLS